MIQSGSAVLRLPIPSVNPEVQMNAHTDQLQAWLRDYGKEHSSLLKENPDFAEWLATEYSPIAGGWQY
jgi:hypothetical protein